MRLVAIAKNSLEVIIHSVFFSVLNNKYFAVASIVCRCIYQTLSWSVSAKSTIAMAFISKLICRKRQKFKRDTAFTPRVQNVRLLKSNFNHVDECRKPLNVKKEAGKELDTFKFLQFFRQHLSR